MHSSRVSEQHVCVAQEGDFGFEWLDEYGGSEFGVSRAVSAGGGGLGMAGMKHLSTNSRLTNHQASSKAATRVSGSKPTSSSHSAVVTAGAATAQEERRQYGPTTLAWGLCMVNWSGLGQGRWAGRTAQGRRCVPARRSCEPPLPIPSQPESER